jgi:hypothetical protein
LLHVPQMVPPSHAERIALLAALVTLCACAGLAREVREYTYPRDFEYLGEGEIHSVMGQLAVNVRALDALLAEGAPPSGAQRERVVELLRAMEQVARALGSDEVRSNHAKLDLGSDAFRERLAAARRAAQRDPPDYYLAGSVSGACRYCHHP